MIIAPWDNIYKKKIGNLSKNIENNKEVLELKNTISEILKCTDELSSRVVVIEKNVSELEYQSIEIINLKNKQKKSNKKKIRSLKKNE